MFFISFSFNGKSSIPLDRLTTIVRNALEKLVQGYIVLLAVAIGAVFLSFLTDYSLMEFFAMFLRPVMRKTGKRWAAPPLMPLPPLWAVINNIVSGRNNGTTISTIKKLCDGFDIPIEEFFYSELFKNLEQKTK